MAEMLRIRGGKPLQGDVWVSGSKNAAVAIIPAALLADSPCTIDNLPDIEDVYCLKDMLEYLGASVEFKDGTMYIDPTGVKHDNPPAELATRMRASYYLVPVLLGKLGSASVPMPGGCNIGERPIDQTINGLTALGADVNTDNCCINARKTENFSGADVFLSCPSVGATINTMLTAVSAPGKTVIHNAAREPHIVDTANFLSSMGAKIKGAGTDTIRINGGLPLHGSSYTVIPDQIETGTLMIAAAATHGCVTVHGTIPVHMESLTAKLLEAGVSVTSDDDRITVRPGNNMRGITVNTQVYPGFPTDLQQPLTAMLTTANGMSMVVENIFDNRFRYVRELQRMKADIKVIENNKAVISGVQNLTACSVTATDLRAGAAMIVAALMADGVSDIYGVHYIMRGYEHIDEKLRSLGVEAEFI